MNPEVKAKWVEALRSGNYKQTQGRLKRHKDGEESYCCLGVLCDISPAKEYEVRSYGGHSTYLGSINQPPHIVLEWAGLGYSDVLYLMTLNDISLLSFNVIADIVEMNF